MKQEKNCHENLFFSNPKKTLLTLIVLVLCSFVSFSNPAPSWRLPFLFDSFSLFPLIIFIHLSLSLDQRFWTYSQAMKEKLLPSLVTFPDERQTNTTLSAVFLFGKPRLLLRFLFYKRVCVCWFHDDLYCFFFNSIVPFYVLYAWWWSFFFNIRLFKTIYKYIFLFFLSLWLTWFFLSSVSLSLARFLHVAVRYSFLLHLFLCVCVYFVVLDHYSWL